ncbi:hypothetical protein [uncultured Sulfuricurvum sp.]|uniref:hypothetical protein n=1 Tax=uncultured Sulfuricurvum sp. TaxID=430693 RepID=UPI0026369E6F|nr:hypothetical protein [uncultured Sulfuricurvum sp.]
MANLFLFPLKSIADLFGIESIPALLYKNIEKDALDKLPLSERTFRNLLNGEKQPTPKTLDKLSSMIPFVDWDHTHEFSNYMTGWEFFVYSPSYEDLPFPYFKKKFATLAIEEASIIKEVRNYASEDERMQFVFNHPFIHSFLTPNDISIITTGSDFNTNKKIVITKLHLNILLYCIAYIDAEYGISRKEDRGDRFSFIKKILPKFDQDNYINPIESFFKLLKDHYKTTYTEMAKSINVDTNNPDEKEQLASKKRKFRTWRSKESKKLKRASYDEIKNILRTLEPELDEIGLNYSALLYYYALFLHNLFQDSLKSKIDDIDLFKSDRELVKWIKTLYDNYFEEAYVEIEELITKDAQSIFG